MITPLKEKLFVNGYQHPCYTVKDKTFYSKPLAIKYCTEVGWEWPTFQVWKHSQKFTRPKKTFEESLKTQCELISDTCDKVRLFYSGGRDSGLILDSMLKYKGKLDEKRGKVLEIIGICFIFTMFPRGDCDLRKKQVFH